MNAINIIRPYKYHGLWVFDDPKFGLVQEPFVGGADTMIVRLVGDIPNADGGFTIVFSASPFPGFQHQLVWRRAEMSGNVYASEELGMEGWLCPALLKYFDQPPQSLFLQIKKS